MKVVLVLGMCVEHGPRAGSWSLFWADDREHGDVQVVHGEKEREIVCGREARVLVIAGIRDKGGIHKG